MAAEDECCWFVIGLHKAAIQTGSHLPIEIMGYKRKIEMEINVRMDVTINHM